MKKLTTAAIAALALATIIPASAYAAEPATPVQGAICNLYLIDTFKSEQKKEFNEMANSIASKPAAATFVDTASDFKSSNKKDGVVSSWGMWTGWMKVEKAGTYTFLCKRSFSSTTCNDNNPTMYSIWINGQKCIEAGCGQKSFNVELRAGFNDIKIVAESPSRYDYPLAISYKKAGSVKEPISFGPENMYHDDED